MTPWSNIHSVDIFIGADVAAQLEKQSTQKAEPEVFFSLHVIFSLWNKLHSNADVLF